MSGLDYARAEEVAATIPVIRCEVNYVMYGPLAEFPGEPEIVLIFAHARQGLIPSEAIARIDNGAPPALERPACAALPPGSEWWERSFESRLLRRARLSRRA